MRAASATSATPATGERFGQVALIAVMLAAFTEALTVAFNIGAIMTRFGASGTEAGFVATAQGLSVAIAALGGTWLIMRFPARKLVTAGLVLVASGHALALLAQNITMMAVFQALGGLGTGLVVCVVMATAARTRKPEMTYGWINASVGAYLSVLALIVPRMLVIGGFSAAYTLYTALALAGLALVALLPDGRAPRSPPTLAPDHLKSEPFTAKVGANGSTAGWIALVGMGLLYFSIAGLGAFIVRIGARADASLPMIGLAFFVGGILTIICPIGAGLVGARFGSTRPLFLIGSLMCAAALGIALGHGTTGYFISIPLWIVLPAVLTPSFLGGMAVMDPTGRMAGAQPAFATLGGSMGPITAGAVADANGFGSLGWFIVAALVISISLMAVGTTRADKLRQSCSSA